MGLFDRTKRYAIADAALRSIAREMRSGYIDEHRLSSLLQRNEDGSIPRTLENAEILTDIIADRTSRIRAILVAAGYDPDKLDIE